MGQCIVFYLPDILVPFHPTNAVRKPKPHSTLITPPNSVLIPSTAIPNPHSYTIPTYRPLLPTALHTPSLFLSASPALLNTPHSPPCAPSSCSLAAASSRLRRTALLPFAAYGS